jgi:DNA-binding transcriptional LysR family regulator
MPLHRLGTFANASVGSLTMKWTDRIGRRLKLHDLHILLTVAEMGSMGKAAEQLAISQPSISKAIADIEHTIGVRLLDRTPNGVETTPYGRVLLRRGRGAFDELRQGIRDIELLADPSVGEVRVGCPEAIAAGLLSAVVDQFSRRHPRVVVKVIEANNMWPGFLPLRDRVVDLLVGRVTAPFAEEDLYATTLYQDRMFIVSGQNSQWARRRKIELAELVNERWLLSPETEAMIIPLLQEAFQANGLGVPKVSIQSYSVHQRINLLASDRFISALSGSVIHFNADRFSLKVLPIDFATRPWPVAIITLKNRTLNPVVQCFIDCVSEVALPLAGDNSRLRDFQRQ